MVIYDTISNMENFFKAQEEKIEQIKNSSVEDIYEQIFLEASSIIRREIHKFKPENPCQNCSQKDCKIEKKDIFTPYPPNCEYRNWQLKIITFLSTDFKQKLKSEYKDMMQRKDKYICNQCGACCKFETSPFSYEQLKQQASKGNKYAEDFVSIYVPYNNEEEAKNANPEFYEELNKLVKDDRIYYYYCSKYKDNKCTIYENRPEICRDFPKNPLKLLPATCSYNEWREEISHKSQLLKAEVDIIKFFEGRLK